MYNLKWILIMLLFTTVRADPTEALLVPSSPQTLAYSPDGTMIAGAGIDLLRVWDAQSGTTLIDFPIGQTHAFDVSWSPDSTKIISSSYDQYVRVWNVSDPGYSPGQLLWEVRPFPSEPNNVTLIGAVSWRPNGQQIAIGGRSSGGSGPTLKIWDADTFTLVQELGGGWWIEELIWHPTEPQIAISGHNSSPIIVSLSDERMELVGTHLVPALAMAWNSDGSQLAAGYTDGSIIIWDTINNAEFTIMPAQDPNPIYQLAWSSDDTRIASAGTAVRVWNAASGELLETPARGSLGVAFSPDGNYVATGDNTPDVQILPAPLLADLVGQITLFAPGTSTYPLQLNAKLVDPVSEAIVHNYSPTPDSTGAFTIEGVIQDIYDVWLKHPMALAVMPQVNVNAASFPVNFGTLQMGDTNNDNVVNLIDFSLLASTFGKASGQSGYNATADFDGSNTITLPDFSLLASNYDQDGVPNPEGGSAPFGLLSSGTVDLTLNPAATTVDIGQEFDVTVRVEAGTQTVDGAAAYLTFDPELLEVVSVTAGTSLSVELRNDYDNTEGRVNFAAGKLSAFPSGTFTLATVRFRALAETASTGINYTNDNPLRASDATFGGQSVLNATEPAGVTITDPNLIFRDGFESGSLSAWSSATTDSDDLSVTTGAALVGSYGMQAVIDDNTSIFVTDNTPNAETRYRVRFSFDPNSITMANGNSFIPFIAQGGSRRAIQVLFNRSGGSYQMQVRTQNDAGTYLGTATVNISDAPHVIEILWVRATAAGANDGTLTFWLDGVQVGSVTGIDSDGRTVDTAQFGAVEGIDTGTRGTLYFDAFESRRD